MSNDIHTPVEVTSIDDMVKTLMLDAFAPALNTQLEIWGYDYQGEFGSLNDEDLFLTYHNNRIVLCVGEFARNDFVEFRLTDIRILANKKAEAIKEARRVLRMYGAGLEDDE